MEIKKNPEADLERRSGLFLNIGLCISLILVIAAFEWRSYDRGAAMDLGSIDDDFEDLMEIPPTEQPPPPPLSSSTIKSPITGIAAGTPETILTAQ